MAADNYTLISGVPFDIGGVLVRQPTLHEIFKVIGYDSYSAYIYVVGLTLDQFFEANKTQLPGLREAFAEMPKELQEQLNIFEVLLAEPSWRALLVKALSFFIVGDIVFDEENGRLVVMRDGVDAVMVNADLFSDIRSFIYQAGCFKAEDEKPKGFYNKAAKSKYEQLLALKGERDKQRVKKRDPDMEMWNLIGAVSANSNCYSLLNIWELTVFQLYDQFGRISKKKFLDGYASKWAVWGTDKFDFDEWFKTNSDKKNV